MALTIEHQSHHILSSGCDLNRDNEIQSSMVKSEIRNLHDSNRLKLEFKFTNVGAIEKPSKKVAGNVKILTYLKRDLIIKP